MLLNPFTGTDLYPEVGLELMHCWAYADIIVRKATEYGVACSKWPCLCRKTAAPNSSVMSDYKPEVVIWSKLHMRRKNRQIRQKSALDGKKFHVK